jgi:hypothetical protein
VERAKPEVIGAPAFQFYERPYNVEYIDSGKDLLYGVLSDQAPNIGWFGTAGPSERPQFL